MSGNIEALLRDSRLSYTKQVDHEGEEAFMFPFSTTEGLITVRLSIRSRCIWASVFLRALDELGLTSHRDLYLDLLRDNSTSLFARAFVWRDQSEEVDWIAVGAEAPEEGLSPDSVAWLVTEVGALAEKVLVTIARHTGIPQPERR